MRLHYQRAVRNNFGDSLNGWLWERVLPGLWRADDETIFVGIGTIIDRHIPAAPLRLICGSGAGYAPPPHDLEDPSWRIYGVRGLLTARVLGLPPALALTDPAILVGEFSEYRRSAAPRTLFVPHWKSLFFGAWRAICNELGITFIDPCGDSHAVIGEIASARLVIAESMHAAIIADAFRVPWIPVALSREVSSFKWADFTLSKGLPYAPFALPPSTAIEALRDRMLGFSVFQGMISCPAGAGGAGPERIDFHDLEQLLADFERICARLEQRWRYGASVMSEACLKRMARLAQGRAHFYNRARDSLAAVAARPGLLSTDKDHTRQLARMHEALDRVRRDHAEGFCAKSAREACA